MTSVRRTARVSRWRPRAGWSRPAGPRLLPRSRPQHAVAIVLRWNAAMSWVVLALVAVTGAALAYARGSALAGGAPVPVPAPDEFRQAAQAHGLPGYAELVEYATSAGPGTGTSAGSADPHSAQGAHGAAAGLAASGIPETALLAYREAAQREATVRPDCHIPWELLAAIGRVESNHGRFAGATLYSDGLSVPPVIGIPLNGDGTALIRDTDHGRLDGDTVYDHAVGPMQFIPSTWASWGVDANGDGVADPFNIFDAAAAAADYLCAAGGDLATGAGQTRAILAYNHSSEYLSLVLGVESVYSNGAQTYPSPTHPPKPPKTIPPVNPGPPASPPPTDPPSSPSSSPSASSSSTPPSSTDSSSPPPDCPSPSDTASTSTDSSTPSDTPSASDATDCDSSSSDVPPTSTEPPTDTSTDTASTEPPDTPPDGSSS